MVYQYVDVADTDTRRRNLTHVALLILGAFLAANLVVLAGIEVLDALGYTLEGNQVVVYGATFALNYVGFFLVAFWYLERYDRWELFDVGLPSLRDLGLILGGVVGLAVVSNLLALALQYVGVETAQNVTVEQGTQNPELLLLLIPIAFFLNAPSEELLYRGIVQGLFRDAYGVLPGILIAASVFGAIHWLALGGDGSRLSYVAVAAALGLVLGVLYEATENLTVPIAVHGIWNAYLYGSLYVAETGLA